MSASDLQLSLVIPTYNESENLLTLLGKIQQALGPLRFEVIVVDDNSPDQTWRLATVYGATHPWVRVIRRESEKGLSSAVLAGFEAAHGEILGVMDADLSHDETILPKLVDAVQNGTELAVGSRRVPGGGATAWPWYRRLSSTAATLAAKLLLDVGLSDPMSGFFLLRRSLYESCKDRLAPKGYKILLEIYCKGRPKRIQEIPFIFKDRRQGYSKMTRRVIGQYVQMLLLLKFDEFIQRVRYRYHTGRYAKVRQYLKDGTVLDIGCGRPCETMPDGSFLRFLGRGTGVDVKPLQGPFNFVQGSLLALPFPDRSFDNVVAMEVLEHVTEPDKAFSEISRVLKDDGRFVMSVPDETWLWSIIWEAWEGSFGYMWHETHTGTRSSEEWTDIVSRYFQRLTKRRHWYFDLIFLHQKSARAKGSR